MNFLQRTLLYQGGKVRYGTAGTTTTTTLASSGGLLINIDSATGDIAVTTDNWIEDEKYGIYADVTAGTASAEFDTAVTRTGTKTLKISATNAAGKINAQINPNVATIDSLSKYCPRLKPSTKYRLRCFCKTNNVAAASAVMTIIQYSTTAVSLGATLSNTLSGTNDWTLLSIDFTSNASAEYVRIFWQLNVAGNISDAWFDINSMTLEEVVEPVANSLTSSSPSLVSFTAVGSTDNIDQSQLVGTTSSVIGNFGGLSYLHSQSFTATKSKLTGVYLYKRANTLTPTGNLKVDIRTNNAGDPSSTILATYTIPLATYNALTTNAEFLVNLPCNLTAGTLYHIVVSDTATETAGNFFNIGGNAAGGYTGGDSRFSTNGGTTWAVAGTSDFYFKTLYYKPTTNFKASQNNETLSISADEDGFLDGSIINLTTGSYSMSKTFGSAGTGHLITYDTLVGSPAVQGIIQSGFTDKFRFDNAGNYLTVKVEFGLTVSGIVVGTKFVTGGTNGRTQNFQYSTDNSSWNDIVVSTTSNNTVESTYSIPGSMSTVYIRWYNTQANSMNVYYLNVNANVDTSSLSTLRNYPTNKDIISQYSTTLGSATTSATYRATKWGFPAIEYSATEYQFLNIDTTATGSTVAFSETGTSYTTVADGASLAITSTSTPSIFVKHNITANRLFISSNDYSASSDKDGSLRQSVVYQVIQ